MSEYPIAATAKPVRIEHESAEQAELMEWARAIPYQEGKLADYLTHVPNEGKRGPKAKRDFHRLGGSPGYPDLILDIPNANFHGLRIEMKARKGKAAAVTPKQKVWMARLNAQGYQAQVCYGALEAKEVITQYLEGIL